MNYSEKYRKLAHFLGKSMSQLTPRKFRDSLNCFLPLAKVKHFIQGRLACAMAVDPLAVRPAVSEAAFQFTLQLL